MNTHLKTSRDLSVAFLESTTGADWATPIPELDFTIAGMCAHMTQTGFWYAIDFAARDGDLAAVVPQVKADSEPAELIRALSVGVDLLCAVIEAAPPDARGFHPFGQADASGFAAMACDEMLIHTSDIARALGAEFSAPSALAAAVLERLFPWVTGDEDPWSLLLSANGRIELPGRPRRRRWRWHCAPLDEWDGTDPSIND